MKYLSSNTTKILPKAAITIVLMIFGGSYCAAQIDYNRIIKPDYLPGLSFEEKLVQLAWQNNPISEISNKETDIAWYRYKKSHWNWLNSIVVAGNINEFSIDSDLQGTNVFFPRYNFSATVPLGIFSSFNSKIAKQELEVARSTTNQRKLEIRAEVLKQYENYKMYQKLLQSQSALTNIENSYYLSVEDNYTSNSPTVSLEDYNAASRAYNEELIKKIQLENQLSVSKLELERIIGIPLEEVE